jgi:ribosomal protein L11 methyltransferase
VLAFGTGLHPTTRLTAGFIENKRNEIKEFLDIGTGTGILSIVARKYGVSWVGGLDNDQGSITTACKNAMANGCSFDYLKVADINTLTLCREFDFVAANLLAPILIGARDRIVSLVRPGKYLAVSGVTTSDYPRFRKAFATPQLRCVRLLRSHGWIAALYQRKNTK